MKPKTVIPLVVGLGVGFLAIKLGMDMVQRAKGAPSDVAAVLVSNQRIEVASLITESMLSQKEVPPNLVPRDAFTDPKELNGRVTAMSIVPGVPITKAMLAPPGSEPGLRSRIPSGHRAVSVKVNEASAVAGFVTPGSRVDVAAAVRGPDGRMQSKTILTDIEVGAVGQSMSEVGKDGKTVRVTKSVTLFVHPEEAQKLHAATAGSARVSLALRGGSGDPVGRSFWAGLFENKPEPEASPPPKIVPNVVQPPERHVVQIVRGTEEEQLVFEAIRGTHRFRLLSEDEVAKAALLSQMQATEVSNVEPSRMENNE